MILPKDHTVRNIISVYQYMKNGKNEGQRIKSINVRHEKINYPANENSEFDVITIEYENGSIWTMSSDEFDSIIESKKEMFDEEFLCIQHLVGLYFKGASAEFIDTFAKILKSDLNDSLHDLMPDLMMEAGYRKTTRNGKGGWSPDKVERLLPSEVIKENKFLADGSDEWGCYPND